MAPPLRERGGGKVGKGNPISHPNPSACEWGLPALTTGIRDGGGYKDTSLRLLSVCLTSAGKTSRGCGYILEHSLREGWLGWRWLGAHSTCFALWTIRSRHCLCFLEIKASFYLVLRTSMVVLYWHKLQMTRLFPPPPNPLPDCRVQWLSHRNLTRQILETKVWDRQRTWSVSL